MKKTILCIAICLIATVTGFGQNDLLNASAKSYPVNGFFNDTLFLIYNKLGSFTAHDRALAISERINTLKNDYSFTNKSLMVVESETTFDIVNGETVILSVSENDAIWNNTTKKDLAKHTLKLKKLSQALSKNSILDILGNSI